MSARMLALAALFAVTAYAPASAHDDYGYYRPSGVEWSSTGPDTRIYWRRGYRSDPGYGGYGPQYSYVERSYREYHEYERGRSYDAPVYPPPVAYYQRPVVVYRPHNYARDYYDDYKPSSCGQYRYWNGDRCVDARYRRPYLGPRY